MAREGIDGELELEINWQFLLESFCECFLPGENHLPDMTNPLEQDT